MATSTTSSKLDERQATLEAWQEFQATGLHLTLEEADSWLAKLEAGEETEPPECHR